MISMALGNIWGGRSADKDPNPNKLYVRMIVAAVWIVAIPLLGKYVILAVSGALVLTISNISVILFLFCSVFSSSGNFAFWEKNLLYEGESIYNYLQVKNTKDSVILSTNVLLGVQSIMKKDNNLTGMYYDYALAAPVMSGINNKKMQKF